MFQVIVMIKIIKQSTELDLGLKIRKLVSCIC